MLLRTRFVFLLAALYVAGHTNAIAQATERDQDVRGTWVVTVDGEPETRTLVISEVASTGTGALLAAKYGITGRGQSAVEARLRQEGSVRHLRLVTQAATIIAVAEQPDGSYTGSFTRKNGVASNVIVARTSASTQAAKPAPPKDLTVLVPLSSDVPPECAIYHGVWVGTWSQGGIADQYLRVLEMTKKDSACVARISYTASKEPVAARTLVELRVGDNLSFLCNRSTGGTCAFKRVGDDLWSSYSNPSGGSNSAVFRRAPQ